MITTLKNSRLKSQKGLSIIAVTISLMLLIILAMVATSLMSVRVFTSADAVGSARALYIAESGLAVAKQTLYTNWSVWSDPSYFPETSFAGGTFDVEVSAGTDPNEEVILTSTGIYGDSKRVIQSTISRYSDAMTSAVYSNGSVSMSGSASVTGDIVESDIPIPGLNTAAAIAAAKANKLNGYASRADGNYFQGDFSPNPSSLNGVIFIDTFAGGSPANVSLASNVSTNDGNPAFMMIMGDLRISGNVTFHGLIYTSGTTDIDTTFLGSMELDGGLITSGDVTLQGNSDITYNEDMVITATTTGLLIGEDSPQEVTWRETAP